jgi:hypothetical protein
MRTLDWHERLSDDCRVVAIGDAIRNGAPWVYADCRNHRACDSLFDSLWEQGRRTLARKGPAQLWLEREVE